MTYVSVTIEGGSNVRRRIRGIDPVMVQSYLKDIGEYTRSVAYSLAPKDTKRGASNIYVNVRGFSAEVVSPDTHMYVMEYGRRRGARQPSTNVLIGWGQRHGFVGKKALFALSLGISRNGIIAHKFMKRAADAARTKMSADLRKLAIRIEREWSR